MFSRTYGTAIRRLSIFKPTIATAGLMPFVGSSGKIEYLKTHQAFPHFNPPPLPGQPVNVHNFMFNRQPISPTNPYGLVQENTNHRVYRSKAPSGEVYYLKDMSQSKVGGMRDQNTARYSSVQESFANWLMYHIFGPILIPKVFPVIHGDVIGIASSEVSYFGTLHQLALRAGYSELEIAYDGASAIQVIHGKTYIKLGDEQDVVRIVGRIALKVALRMLVAHYDIENHHKNIFMTLVPDLLKSRQVACPGIFDLGCVFCLTQMRELIAAYKNPVLRKEIVRRLAEDSVDARIQELNVEDCDKITGRYLTKYWAFKRLGSLPDEKIQEGLLWFKHNAPQESHERIELIGEFLFCSKAISLEVQRYIGEHFLDKDMESEVIETEKPRIC